MTVLLFAIILISCAMIIAQRLENIHTRKRQQIHLKFLEGRYGTPILKSTWSFDKETLNGVVVRRPDGSLICSCTAPGWKTVRDGHPSCSHIDLVLDA